MSTEFFIGIYNRLRYSSQFQLIKMPAVLDRMVGTLCNVSNTVNAHHISRAGIAVIFFDNLKAVCFRFFHGSISEKFNLTHQSLDICFPIPLCYNPSLTLKRDLHSANKSADIKIIR